MLYIVYFSDGSTAIFDEQALASLLQVCMYDPYFCGIVSYEEYVEPPLEPEPEPEPPPGEPLPAPPCSISITAPDSAQEGEKVSLSATITNNSSYAQLYKTELYAGTEFIGSIEDTIPGYSSRNYGGSFVMPARDVTVLIWVEVWRVDHWDYNNSASKMVSLVVPPPPPEFAGTISRKELEYDHVERGIPVY